MHRGISPNDVVRGHVDYLDRLNPRRYAVATNVRGTFDQVAIFSTRRMAHQGASMTHEFLEWANHLDLMAGYAKRVDDSRLETVLDP